MTHWLSILIGTISAFVIGFVWYGPLFGKKWAELTGMTDEKRQNVSMGKVFGTAIVLTAIMATVIALHMPAGSGLMGGLHFGMMIGVILFCGFGINAQFAQTPLMLTLIDGGYMFATATTIGAVIGAMGG